MKLFVEKKEIELSKKFIKDGYVKIKADDIKHLNNIKKLFKSIIDEELKKKNIKSSIYDYDIFNKIHKLVPVSELNDFRLSVINKINNNMSLRKSYFESAKSALFSLVGNELAMQSRVNLSIQYPNDASSLLPVHADTWSGDSPYEVVVWIPLVDCYKTKAMYLLPPNKEKSLTKKFTSELKNSEKIFSRIKNFVNWIDIKYGEVLLFNQSLPHGNRVNKEKDTRWSLNCRFKSIFTPYGDKKIGEFFEPITLKTASQIGVNYKFPK